MYPNHSGGYMNYLFQQKNKLILFVLFFAFVGFWGTSPVQADFLLIENTLKPDEEVNDDLYLQGNEVLVAGKVHGMLFAVGESVTIASSAEVDNDIFILGKNVVVEKDAKISGNLFTVGQNVVVQSNILSNLVVGSVTLDLPSAIIVEKNVFFGGFHVSLAEGSVVKDNFYAGCYQISIAGDIEENLRVSAISVDLSGIVKKNAEIMIDASGDDEGIRILVPYMQQFNIPELLPTGLVVSGNASINGKLIYTSAKSLEENLKNLPLGGVIENLPENTETEAASKNNIVQKNPFLSRILRMVRQSIGFLLFAFLTWRFGKHYLYEAVHYATNKPLQALGSGFLSILVVYIGAMVISFILILVSLLFRFFTLNQLGAYLFFLGISCIIISLVFMSILIMYGSKLVVAYWAGKFLIKNSFKREYKEVWYLVTGIILYLILNLIPVLGWIIGVVISLIGIGAIWYTLQNHDRAGILPDFE